MSPTLFFDPACQQPYDTMTLRQQAMGGSEATVTRVADALEALVVQHNRSESYGRYRAPERMPEIQSVVINRDSRAPSPPCSPPSPTACSSSAFAAPPC